jgi:hypothetical protein
MNVFSAVNTGGKMQLSRMKEKSSMGSSGMPMNVAYLATFGELEVGTCRCLIILQHWLRGFLP